MAPPGKIVVLILTVAVGVLLIGCEGKSLMLSLERANHEGVGMNQLRHRDRVRHGRILKQVGAVDFPVDGTYDPYLVGLYFTRVKLGTPPKEFNVQIDTGSDVLWVSCEPCVGCPKSSGLQIKLEFFDVSASSTANSLSCSDPLCTAGSQSSDAFCTEQSQCGYTFQYGDGSGTTGYYVSDYIQLDTIISKNSSTSTSSARIAFGCSTSDTGDLTTSDRAVDGIFGFGPQALSVTAQLSSQGITPNAFSHCLRGENGGGILVLGQIVDPNMVYTPLVPEQPHYNANLRSISVDGKILDIDSSMFTTSDDRGTIFDSGSTLAYFPKEAYDPFVAAVTQSVSQDARPLISNGTQCYLTVSSNLDIFPPVSLNFAGSASMNLRPQDYLLQQSDVGDAGVWCIGIQRTENEGIIILGDLVLKDKIVAYDLDGQTIGWANYDCSSPVNISTKTGGGRTEFFTAISSDVNRLELDTMMLLLLHIALFNILLFL